MQDFYPRAEEDDAQAVGKAVATAALKDNPPFEEQRPYEAVGLLPHQQCVYTPAYLESGEIHFDRSKITLEPHQLDGFPSAGITSPMGQPQWHSLLFDWISDAGLDMVDILSDANVCLGLLIDSSFAEIPFSFKAIYISITGISLCSEVSIAVAEVRTHDAKWLQRIYDRYGIRSWVSSFAKSTFLRYLQLPHLVDNAYELFNHRDKGGYNLNPRHAPPLIGFRGKALQDYFNVAGFLAKLPKVLMEDSVLFAMNLYMTFVLLHKFTAGLILSAMISAYSLTKNTIKFYTYIFVLRRAARALADRLDNGDPPLAGVENRSTAQEQWTSMISNPVRRLLMLGIKLKRQRVDGQDETDPFFDQ